METACYGDTENESWIFQCNVCLLEHSTLPQAEVRMFIAFSLTVCKWKAGLRIHNR